MDGHGASGKTESKSTEPLPERRDLTKVRREIERLLHAPDHDDGSFGPLFIRLAWHCSGTFDQHSNTGGSNGCTMRFEAEQSDPENAGLGKARERLSHVKEKFPEMSWADLYILAGNVAIEASGGPHIPFRHGRVDFSPEQAERRHGPSKCPFGDGKFNPHGSRLPTADLGPDESVGDDAPDHEREAATIAMVRGTFQRLGFSDRETVCLVILGHQYGRCHPEVSGYEEAWYAFDPAHWNVYEHGLGYLSTYRMGNYQEVETQAGKRQYNLRIGGRAFMMLPVDRVLWWDPEYRQHVCAYDDDRRQFKRDAVKAWQKLTELGCQGLVEELPPKPRHDRRY